MLISASDIIKKSIDLYKNNSKLFLTYSLLFMVPGVLITLASFSLPFFLMITDSLGLGFLLYGVFILVISLSTLWLSISFVRVIVARYENRDAGSIGTNLKEATSLVLPVILVSILTGLAVLGGLILLVIPGIIFSIWFAFGFYALVLDNKRGTEALKHSKSLVAGRWWGVFWRLLAPALVFGIITSIIQWIIGIPFGSGLDYETNFSFSVVLYAILSGVVSMLFMPLSTSAPTILYEELKKTPLYAKTELPEAQK